MLKIQEVSNLIWADAEKTCFECAVKYAEIEEVLPVGVNASDRVSHIAELWAKANAGTYGPIAEFVAPIQPERIAVPVDQQPVTTGAQEL